ncbi:TPA: DUF6369 family protein [Vibrio vulnificus]
MFTFLRKYNVGLFVIALGVVLPYSPIFGEYFYYSGANVFDFYIIGVGIGSTLLFLVNQRLMTMSLRWLCILVTTLILLLLSYFISIYNDSTSLIGALKDLKPIFIIVILFYSFKVLTNIERRNGNACKEVSYIKSFVFSRLFLLFICIKVLFFLFLNINGYLSLGTVDDFYVSDMDMINRYTDYSIYFILVVTIILLSNKGFFIVFPSYYSLVGIVLALVSGNRTFFCIFIVMFLFSISKSYRAAFYIFLIVSIPIGLSLFDSFSLSGDSRFLSLLSYEKLASSLSTRYSPFFALYDEGSNFFDYFFGLGLGTLFYIPWFSYRDGVDPLSAFIDNFYLTIFAKFGLFGLVVIVLVIISIIFRFSRDRNTKALYLLIFFMYTSTMSFWYQQSFTFLSICFFTILFYKFKYTQATWSCR